MPFLAILQHDLRTLAASWLVRLWLAASALLTLILTLSHWNDFSTPVLVASLLFPYLVFPWFLVVMVLGVGPVSATRTESLADGILSRPVTRYEYLLASWSSRVVLVLGAYLLVVLPAIAVLALANRPAPGDAATAYGVLGALGATALVMIFQVSLAFLLGTVLQKPLLAVVLLMFIWYPINGVLSVFSLEEFSPISLNQALPTLLRQPWHEVEEDPQQAATDEELAALSRQAAHFLKVLSGGAPTRGSEQPVEQKPTFFDHAEYADFSLANVLLGYGIPTLAAVALATLCFCLRDL